MQAVTITVMRLRRYVAGDQFDVFGDGGTGAIDWATALMTLDKLALDPDSVNSTLGVLLKYQDDIAKVQGSEAARILDTIRAEMRAVG